MNKINTIEELQALLALLLASRTNPNADFGVVSMCCGSGRTPDTQHWPIKEIGTRFQYKDTIVTYDEEKNNLELITYGPGTGENRQSALDAARGLNPSIEEISAQQKEIYQAVSTIREMLHQKNEKINILPKATIIGFSRGGVAVQKMSKELIQPLPICYKTDDMEIVGDHLQLELEGGRCVYSVYNEYDSLVKEGDIDPSALQTYKINHLVDRTELAVNVNKFLCSKNERILAKNILVDPDNTLWISLDAVAGRPDKLNDHDFNNEYCRGLYVISTRLAMEHAFLGFGATDPRGESMKKLAINGKHGGVFDDKDLRQVIIENTSINSSMEKRLSNIENAINEKNKELLEQSIMGKKNVNGFSFTDYIRHDPLGVLTEVKNKVDEPNCLLSIIGNYLGLGPGLVRISTRTELFAEKQKKIENILEKENTCRQANFLPSLENYAEARKALDEFLLCIEEYIHNKKGDSATSQLKKDISKNLLNNLFKLRNNMKLDTNIFELAEIFQLAKKYIANANISYNELAQKKSLLNSFFSGARLKKPLDIAQTRINSISEKFDNAVQEKEMFDMKVS